MKHITFSETAKKIAASDWGKKFESDQEAQAELIKSLDLSGACLLEILRRVDNVISSLIQVTVADSVRELHLMMEREINQFVASREEKHGPCPFAVKEHFENSMMRQVGRRLMHGYEIPACLYEPRIPPKGTPVRDEYDKWMRKRVSKKPRSRAGTTKESGTCSKKSE